MFRSCAFQVLKNSFAVRSRPTPLHILVALKFPSFIVNGVAILNSHSGPSAE